MESNPKVPNKSLKVNSTKPVQKAKTLKPKAKPVKRTTIKSEPSSEKSSSKANVKTSEMKQTTKPKSLKATTTKNLPLKTKTTPKTKTIKKVSQKLNRGGGQEGTNTYQNFQNEAFNANANANEYACPNISVNQLYEDGTATFTIEPSINQNSKSNSESKNYKSNSASTEWRNVFRKSFNIDLSDSEAYNPNANIVELYKNATNAQGKPIVPFNIEKRHPWLYCFIKASIFEKHLETKTNPYKVRVTVVTKGNYLLQRLKEYVLPKSLEMYKNVFFEAVDENTELIVKITDIHLMKNLMKCYKEARIHHKLYTENGFDEKNKAISGSDLVVKPYACCPILYNGKWRMVFVQGRASGNPVRHYIGTERQRENMYPQIIPKLMEACNKMWCLGYVHGDLHSSNAFYDDVLQKITFIDLESTMKVPDGDVKNYKNARLNAPNASKNSSKRLIAENFLEPFEILKKAAREVTDKVKGMIEALALYPNNVTVVNETSSLFYQPDIF